MIVSHEHKFIFVKTCKTASSSIEQALSAVCGPDDIITPAREDLEDARTVKAQNWRIQHPLVPKRPWLKRLLRRPERYYHPSVGFYEHIPAWRIRAYLGEDVWNSYFKFSFERNPWDRQVSWYHYKTRHLTEKPSFSRFMAKPRRAFIKNYEIYSIEGEIALDHVGYYENLGAEFAAVVDRLGLSGKVTLPRTNASTHDGNYRPIYDDRTRALVSDWYGREIRAFGYEF